MQIVFKSDGISDKFQHDPALILAGGYRNFRTVHGHNQALAGGRRAMACAARLSFVI